MTAIDDKSKTSLFQKDDNGKNKSLETAPK